MLLRQSQSIACIAHQLLAGQGLARKLHAHIVELMGFIDHDHAGVGQKIGHAAVAHIQVGKQQVVIDDHHISLQRLLARQIDVAGLPVRAVRAQAVIFGGRYQRHGWRALIQRRHLRQVTRAGDSGPALHIGHGA